ILGASGVVFGILAGYGLLFGNTDLYIYGLFPVKAKYLISLSIIGELYLGFIYNPSDNVAHFAHLGGALIGFIIIKIWNKQNRNQLY
ncbi:rhomboid family intramembrane serine protease, partial [Klebsiella pneumoniae]|uniref:rhomboid family intramembrane serine protease n=1 Tax=Klebsiella pneumoniae TaxID=573 RepID=UPI0038538874